MLAVAILMKAPAEAKTRLRGVLGPAERAALALAMFRATVDSVLRWRIAARVGVVTPAPAVAALARDLGAEAVPETGPPGINAAAARAAGWACGHGAASLLLLHADIPALDRDEIGTMLAAGRRWPVVIAESADGGSNALLLRPPEALPFCFGPGSAAAHRAAARRAGLPARCLHLPWLSRDLDTPDDLRAQGPRLAVPAPRPSRPEEIYP